MITTTHPHVTIASTPLWGVLRYSPWRHIICIYNMILQGHMFAVQVFQDGSIHQLYTYCSYWRYTDYKWGAGFQLLLTRPLILEYYDRLQIGRLSFYLYTS